MGEAPTLYDRVFRNVIAHGALTTRRLIQEHGPKPNWEALIQQGYLQEVPTIYGSVIGLTERGQYHASGGGKWHVEYVGSAGHLANRAYLMDALQILNQRGYTLGHHVYKRSGGVGTAARNGLKVTDQIIRTVLRVPEDEMRRLKAEFPVDDQRNPYTMDSFGHWGEAVGYPSLYATISNGGISAARIKSLVGTKHKKHLEIWHTPLIIATPKEAQLLPLVRSINSRYRLKQEESYRRYSITAKPIHDLVSLISLAMPGTLSSA